ncbi:AMP-binding enzyme [Toxoplasma gondii VEG]|uniref:AMP-binding enzyme n=1 Tax=Toxoplasma gondii (strain ATCC 50861 / VEG) TaxID=432359 RepID=V4Z897_TOXGV|nr:AMP-binding enzyme [Toxoplasma gondii VEG]CEL72098.1 TPA: hypothetical protein BN1205_055310 [Toxoplasma gondii VEG]
MDGPAVDNSTEPFLKFWEKTQDGLTSSVWLSREDLHLLAAQASRRLVESLGGCMQKEQGNYSVSQLAENHTEQRQQKQGKQQTRAGAGTEGIEGQTTNRTGLLKPLRGVCIAHYMTKNRVEEVILRLAAKASGYIPVTINWDADGIDRILYKIESTHCQAVIVDEEVPVACLNRLAEAAQGRFKVLSAKALCFQSHDNLPVPEKQSCENARSMQDCDLRTLSGGKSECTPSKEEREDNVSLVVFTSGTTGRPKGAILTNKNMETSCLALRQLLDLRDDTPLTLVIVNPLHHVNSSVMLELALRSRRAKVHLVSRYTTSFWRLLADVAEEEAAASGRPERSAVPKRDFRLLTPLVSRHIDFLRELVDTNRLTGVSVHRLAHALRPKEVVLLLGSAPVGLTTVQTFLRLLGKLPAIRFGSTETCLQVMGTPFSLTDDEMMRALERGWNHIFQGRPQKGFYIGRPHPPLTEVEIVKSTDPSNAHYMVRCEAGEPGLLICRGKNCMRGYTASAETSRDLFSSDGWYLGLGDVCFFLRPLENDGQVDGDEEQEERREDEKENRDEREEKETGEKEEKETGEKEKESRLDAGRARHLDYYWVTRSADVVIKGGANYSCAQISDDIKNCLLRLYEGKLAKTQISVATISMKIQSEHEDSCCVTVELTRRPGLGEEQDKQQETEREADAWHALISDINDNFLSRVRKDSSLLPKASVPDYIRIGKIPTNFKGLPDSSALKKSFAELLKNDD